MALLTHRRNAVQCKRISCQGWESGIAALNGQVDGEAQMFLLALNLMLLPWASRYVDLLHVPCWWWLSFFLRHTKYILWEDWYCLFVILLYDLTYLQVTRVRVHLTCEKGHVLFGLEHSSIYILVVGHFAMPLPKCNRHSYMPPSPVPPLSLLITLSRWSACAQLKNVGFLGFLAARSGLIGYFWPIRCKQKTSGRDVFQIKSQHREFLL